MPCGAQVQPELWTKAMFFQKVQGATNPGRFSCLCRQGQYTQSLATGRIYHKTVARPAGQARNAKSYLKPKQGLRLGELLRWGVVLGKALNLSEYRGTKCQTVTFVQKGNV